MKIMVVTPYFSPKIGGLESYALNLSQELKAQGNEVFIVTSNHLAQKRAEETIQGLRVTRLPVLFNLWNTPVNPLWYFSLRKIIKREKPDIINAHSPVPFMADMAILASGKTHTTLTYHAATLEKDGSTIFSIIAKIYGFLQKPSFRKASSIVAVSQYVKDSLPEKYQAKTVVINNAVNEKEVPKIRLRHKKNRLVFIGSLDKTHSWKGLKETLEAVQILHKSIPKIELLILGDGDMRGEYKAIAKELGIETNVIFRGFINGPEKYNLLQSSAALVAYPTTENDAFPTVILEAWAVGTPVIAADMGALHTLIKNNNGKLVKSHSPEHLARAISGVLSNDHQWKLFSDNGRKIVAGSFNWAVSGRNTIAHFEVITRPKICVINNIIAPYRIPVFDGLSGKADVMALFCKPIAKDRFWKYDLDKVGFKYKVLPGFTLGPIIINPTAWWVLMRTKFDVVVCNNDPDVATVGLTSFLLAKLKRARCVDWSSIIDDEVHTFDGQAEGLAVKVTRVVIKRYRMLFISLSDVHMAFSPGAVAYLRNKNVPESKIIRVLNAMPRVLLDNPSTKATHRRNGKKVLYIGYLNARKNVELLIEAFLQINDPDASLTIAGDGDRKEELLTLAKKDKRIKFLGYVEGKVKADLFAASDIFVLPTTNDVWGLVINEALTYNLAVICSDEAEAKELINDKSGRVFRSGDVKSLLSLLNELLSDRRKVQAMQLYNFNRHDLPTTDDMVNGVMKACRVRLV